MDKGLEKLNQSKPTQCERCGGKMIYKGTGEYECAKCKNIMYDDYGKVRNYIDANGASSILILERETGVSKDVLEYLMKDGVLVEPPEVSCTKTCCKCGFPIESGRYCKSCMSELTNGLSTAFKADEKPKAEKVLHQKNNSARMRSIGRDRRNG